MTSEASRVPVGSHDPALRGVPPGSLRFHAVLFAPPGSRRPLSALYSLESELHDCSIASNHDIAHTRLEWWRQELERFAAGRACHPITIALAPSRNALAASQGALNELVTAAGLDLARYTYHTWQELTQYSQQSSGALQTVIATVLAAPQPLTVRESDFARRLGVATRQVEMLRDAQRDARRGLLYAPLDVLAASGVSVSDWTSRDPTPAKTTFRLEWADRLDSMLKTASDSLTGEERMRQRHGLVLGALYRRLLDAVRRHINDDGIAEVRPFARVWTAWRAARAAG